MSTTSLPLQHESVEVVAKWRDYLELTKPRISVLVLTTVAVAGGIARFGQPAIGLLLQAMVGTALVAASASAMNHWLERTRDQRMPRTANRPVASGRLTTRETLTFASLTLAAGAAWLLLACGWQAASFGLATWVIYVCIYTPMKSKTSWNTAVGAISGALPVWIGWAAVGGAADIRAAGLFLLLFFWQFPHFMAIAWLYRRQYGEAGCQMLTVIDPSGRRAGVQAVLGAAALLPTTAVFSLYATGTAGLVVILLAQLLAIGLLAASVSFLVRRDDDSARRLLRASLVCLPGLLTLLLFVPLV